MQNHLSLRSNINSKWDVEQQNVAFHVTILTELTENSNYCSCSTQV